MKRYRCWMYEGYTSENSAGIMLEVKPFETALDTAYHNFPNEYCGNKGWKVKYRGKNPKVVYLIGPKDDKNYKQYIVIREIK